MNANETPSCVLGLDVGGTKLLAGCVGPDGSLLQSRRFAMQRGNQSSTLASIDTALAGFLAEWQGPRPLAVGVGLVGQVDPLNGVWLQAMNLPIREAQPLAERIRASYGLPAWLDNDVHAATLAELRWGAGLRATDFIYLNVGTGLAAGMVANGQLVRGAANYAGELGHMQVDPDGELCVCGQRGCLEPLVSGGAMLARVRSLLPDYPGSPLARQAQAELTTGDIFRAAQAGDALALRVAGQAAQALATALTGLVNLFNPALIVYGGRVLADGWLMARVDEKVRARALPAAVRNLEILPSALDPERVGLLGAACLAWRGLGVASKGGSRSAPTGNTKGTL